MNWNRIGRIMGAVILFSIAMIAFWPQISTSSNPLKIVGVVISLGMIGRYVIQRLT